MELSDEIRETVLLLPLFLTHSIFFMGSIAVIVAVLRYKTIYVSAAFWLSVVFGYARLFLFWKDAVDEKFLTNTKKMDIHKIGK